MRNARDNPIDVPFLYSNILYFLVDGSWRITACSREMAEWLGYSREEVIGQRCVDIITWTNLDESPFCQLPCPLQMASHKDLNLSPVVMIESSSSIPQLGKLRYVLWDDPMRTLHFICAMEEVAPPGLLTARQLQFVHALASGLSHQQIANQYHVALSTVVTQLKRVRRILGYSCDKKLVRWYWRQYN